MKRDYYEVLGVGRDAGEAEIKKAFRKLARQLHPDANPDDPHAEEHFKELAEAYEVLIDGSRRQLYDAYGHDGLRSGGYQPHFEDFGSFSDLFSAFFGAGGFDTAFGGGRRGRTAMQGGDVVVAAVIDLADAARGAGVEVNYQAVGRCRTCFGMGTAPGSQVVECPRCQGTGQISNVARTRFGQLVRTAMCNNCDGAGRVPESPCETCDGRGMVPEDRTLRVDVPPGISDGQRIRLTGRGHGGERGGPSGDLYVVVRVREDERFLRDGEDLITVVDVPAPLAALGTTVQVPTLDGDVAVDIKAGTQPGEVIVLGGRGMPPLQRGRTGDLKVVVNVTIPRKLDRDQRALLEKLADSLNDKNLRSDEGLRDKLRRLLAG